MNASEKGHGMEACEPDGIPGVIAAARIQPMTPIAVLWVVCVAVYTLIKGIGGQGLVYEVLKQTAYLVPFIAAAISSVWVCVVSTGRERRFWQALSTGIVLIALAETYMSVQVVFGFEMTGGLLMLPVILTFVSSAFVLVGLFRLTDFRTLSGTVRLRHLIDTTGLGLLLLGFELIALLVPLSRSYAHANPSELVAAACFSVTGALLLGATVVNFASRSWSRWLVCERHVVIGMGIYAFATAIWPLWYLGAVLDPRLPLDTLIEVLWMSGMLLVFGGAFTRLRSVGMDVPLFRAVPRMRPLRHSAISVTGPVLFVISIPVFGYLAISGNGDPVVLTTYAFVSLSLTVLVALRSGISAVENESLSARAENDPLTEIFGHRYFQERLQLELDLAQRHGDALSIVVVDIDDFSRLNGVFGHSHGDEVLRSVAIAIQGACRVSDVACRLGADEFAVVVPEASVAEAEAVGMRIRATLRDINLGEYGALTASIGIASFPGDAHSREDLFHKANGALYWAKYHGKDRIVVFDESVVESLSAQERISKLEEQSHLATVRALAAAVDARDPLTQFHSRNVAVLAVMAAEEMELGADKQSLIEIAALLHDIGKIGISDRVLRKRGPLTDAEMRHIREHPGLGEKILESTQLVEVLPWVRHHHERWDGTGYPDGLAGDDIPLEARLLCICDAYDAMTTGRPYRTSLSSSAALQELDLCIGTQFDPDMTEAFIRMVGRRRLLRPETHYAHEGSVAAEAG
ncbi:MAG: diguanylate [Actinobacteria bacterium]|nr:MAG: diguanylate [Actinomycetota bacterium]